MTGCRCARGRFVFHGRLYCLMCGRDLRLPAAATNPTPKETS